jgi:hypothetical protein
MGISLRVDALYARPAAGGTESDELPIWRDETHLACLNGTP